WCQHKPPSTPRTLEIVVPQTSFDSVMFDVVKIKASQASLYQIFDDSKPGICVSDFYLGGNGMTYAAVIDKPQRIAQNLSAALPCQRKILIGHEQRKRLAFFTNNFNWRSFK